MTATTSPFALVGRRPDELRGILLTLKQMYAMNNDQPNKSIIGSPDRAGRSTVRGLPDSQARVELAETYLAIQHELWPEMAGTSEVPGKTDESYQLLAEQLRTSYNHDPAPRLEPPDLGAGGIKVGACYLRYSDDNSNTRSLDQQLRNVLNRAKTDGVFVPWSMVLCDAGIPGTTPNRVGFRRLEQLVEESEVVGTVYVDELSRLARNQLDSKRVVDMVQFTGKQLIGVMDGFDSNSEMADISHAFTALKNETFSKDLGRKVIRGAHDKFDRKGNTGAVPTGYKVQPLRDASGETILGPKNKVQMEVVIDEPAAEVVKRIFRMYAEEKLSPARIGNILNNEEALGRTTWNQSTVSQMLKNERYRGRIIWGRNKTVRNPKTRKKQSVRRPESEWKVRQDESMRIVSEELWDAVRRREAEVSRNTHPKGRARKSRQASYPVRLFDLYCKCCDQPLALYRSGKYQMMHCRCGKQKRNGCELTSSKTLHIIDEVILAHLKEQMLTASFMEHLRDEANDYLVEEASKPMVDTAELDRKIRSCKAKIKRLVNRAESLDEGVALDTVIGKIDEAEHELKRLEGERRVAADANFRPEPIGPEEWDALVADLRGLLMDDVAAAASVLSKALGKVYITQGPKRGRSLSWFAELRINPVPLLLEVAQITGRASCPTTRSLEYLQMRSWTIDQTVQAQIFEVRVEHRVAHHAGALFALGCSINLIKDILHVDWRTAKAAVAFAKEHPADAKRLATDRKPTDKSDTKVGDVADEVLRLTREKVPLSQIAKQFDVSHATLVAAFDHLSPSAIKEAAKVGRRPRRAS